MFLRIYELKDKFRYLFHEQKQKKEVIRKISTCIKNKFNGFTMALSNSHEIEKDDVIECFFSTNIRFAYRGTHSDVRSVNNLGHSKLYECYYCNHFFAKKGKFHKHFRSCSSKPGVVYDFNIQNVVTFEDNLSYKGDIPYCVYADFETSAPTDDCLDPENRVMLAVSYALVFAWNPKLKLDRQIVVRGFNHSLEELRDMSYLSLKQLALRN